MRHALRRLGRASADLDRALAVSSTITGAGGPAGRAAALAVTQPSAQDRTARVRRCDRPHESPSLSCVTPILGQIRAHDAGRAARIDGPAHVLSPGHENRLTAATSAAARRGRAPARSASGVFVRTQPRRFAMRCTCVSTQMLSRLACDRISTRFAVLRPTPGSVRRSSIVARHARRRTARATAGTSPGRGGP